MAKSESPRDGKKRATTSTYKFGSGKREGHDASDFYNRFTPPVIHKSEDVCHPDDRPCQDKIYCGDIRQLSDLVAENSVALLVTSPPYFAGKEYEIDSTKGYELTDYADYLEMLTEVLSSCVKLLEPGGRIAVNIANLGRKPYRSLSSDVIGILQNDLGLLLRGEIIWKKSKSASGNCAWGSYLKPANPVLRDITERIVVASKGMFERAIPQKKRQLLGLPNKSTINKEDFLQSTLDVWEFPPERAKALEHPAPFPIELPKRLIELYTYEEDLVLDPFMGSGTTAIAAIRTKRNFIGFDTTAKYVDNARKRIEIELGSTDGET